MKPLGLGAGDKLGPYDLIAQIGEGGMGEVWKARDTRLDRVVAVKVSKLEFTERFEREARAIAALNHPNICQLYDVGPNYLVMEYIEGTQLKGPVPVERAVEYACQILDALDAAHKKGITHRDLKPANILITKQGVKLLDFGLAKQTGPLKQTDATLTKALTAEGQIAGTLQYMAPEQLQAKEADARSDIFAFGCVLYEIISGKKAFQGESAASVIAAILEREPAPLALTPPLDRVIRKCLAKDPDERFQSARDLKYSLTQTLGRPVEGTPSRARWPLWVAGLIVAFILGGFVGRSHFASSEIDSSNWHFTPIASEYQRQSAPQWSPDGKSVVYTAVVAGRNQVFLRPLDSPLAIQLTQGQGGSWPSFSVDGSSVYYSHLSDTGTAIWSVSVAGGTPTKILGSLSGSSATANPGALSPDGKAMVVFHAPDRTPGLWISSPPGAPLKPLPGAPQIEAGTRGVKLHFSPDGKKLLLLQHNPRTELWVLPWPAGTGKARLVYSQPFTVTFGSTADWWTDNRHALLSLTPFGQSAMLKSLDTETGQVRNLSRGLPDFGPIAVSPQGRIAFTKVGRDNDIIEIPMDNSPIRPVLSGLRNEMQAQWSPVADQFVYFTDRNGPMEIWLADGKTGRSAPIVYGERAPKFQGGMHAPVFSSDGRRIAYNAEGAVMISNINGGTPVRLLPEGENVRMPAWSPDDEWIAYFNFKTRFLERAKVGTAIRAPIAEVKHSFVLWSPDGKWITAQLPSGFGLISPDGKQRKILRQEELSADAACGWSRDGSKLYIAIPGEAGMVLWEYDVRAGTERRVRALGAVSLNGAFSYAGLLSVSPDGRSLLSSSSKLTSEIWMLEGVRLP